MKTIVCQTAKQNRLSKAYDRIDELEGLVPDVRAKKRTIEAEKITGDNRILN